jgi:hypothetical protein
MITVDIRGLADVQSMLRNLASEQMPYAMMLALNNTAFGVQKFQKERMPSVFDRPTPLVTGAFLVQKATKQDLTAIVSVDPKRDPVLRVHEEGGRRVDQRLELFLRKRGWLRGDWIAVPTENMRRNRYGNPYQEDIRVIISELPTISGIRGDKRRLFVIPTDRGVGLNHLTPGIYQVLSRSQGRAIKKLYHLVSRAQYKQRLEFEKTAKEEALRLAPGHMAAAVQRAIETAR